MRKLGAIIDFNNIAMRSMFTCQYMGDDNIKNFDTDEECAILVRKIASDLSAVLRAFSPDRVIIACDSRDPWRNDIYKDIDGMTYKGNREKDENKNWTKIFSAFDELKEILKLNGMVVTELNNTEADDLASLWRNSMFDDGFNVLMVSSDKDWSQLVCFNKKDGYENQFCISYNPISVKQVRKLYVSQGFMDWYDSEDKVDIFFSNYDDVKNKLKDIMRSNPKISIEVIDPDRILMDKVMCGDDGDNIPTFYEYYKNGKKVRVTPLKASHIYESVCAHNVDELDARAHDGSLKEAIEKEMKIGIDLDFVSRMSRQRKLVELNPSVFPKTICSKFAKHDKDMKGSGYIISSSVKMETLLKDSKFLQSDYNKPRENSIFDDLNALNKFSKTPNLF